MKKILTLIFAIMAITVSAQTDTVINGKHYRIMDEQGKKSQAAGKHTAPLDSIFVLNNKKLKYYNNWLTVGAGGQQNLSYKYSVGFTGGLDYNFHIKQYYFQLGTEVTGENFGYYNNYEFHLGYGLRRENSDVHYAAFGGISYSTGYGKVDSIYSRPFSQPGLYVQGEFVKKITYDVGIGAAIYADFNKEQSLVGARLILYFSGAYKGKKSGYRED